MDEVDVRLTVPRADQRESTDLIRGEPGLLDEACTQGVVGGGKDQGFVPREKRVPWLRASRLLHAWTVRPAASGSNTPAEWYL